MLSVHPYLPFLKIQLPYRDSNPRPSHYATSRKVADHWIFFNWLNPSTCTMALGLTQPLTEMSTRKYFWEVERGRRVSLTISSPSVSRLSRQGKILDISQPFRPQRSVTGISLYFNVKVLIILQLSEKIWSGYTEKRNDFSFISEHESGTHIHYINSFRWGREHSWISLETTRSVSSVICRWLSRMSFMREKRPKSGHICWFPIIQYLPYTAFVSKHLAQFRSVPRKLTKMTFNITASQT
jgi:hypothetical protein